MGWTKGFYSKQFEWLESPAVWAGFSPSAPPDRARRRAEAVERLAGPGAKCVLELGCGGGIVAAAMAQLGHTVTAVDIVDEAVTSARRYATQLTKGQLTVVQGDFYKVELAADFDVICYFDGFGIGSDADQRRLLRRIAGWLKPRGCALIDVYVPWFFAKDNGEMYQQRSVLGRSNFDPDGCRLLDSIWPAGGDESQAVTQSLRCYSPADLRLLLEGTGLTLQMIEPYASGFEFAERVPLREAAIYLAKLVPAG